MTDKAKMVDGYRQNVGVFVTDGSGRIQILTRRLANGAEVAQIVQGGIDEGETVEIAAVRELTEELGVPANVASLQRITTWAHRYDFPKPHELNGQDQYYALILVDSSTMFFPGADENFVDIRWGNGGELVEGCWEAKRPGYERALKEFGFLKD